MLAMDAHAQVIRGVVSEDVAPDLIANQWHGAHRAGGRRAGGRSALHRGGRRPLLTLRSVCVREFPQTCCGEQERRQGTISAG